MNLFDFIYERVWFPKDHKIRFFEAFSGIGCQAMALKRITDNFEIVGISEIDKYALQSYTAIHGEVKNYGGIGSFDRFPKDIDICTWSFPCTDISLAGQQRGMVDGTRSNYGYEFLNTVERTPKSERPKVLIMENVKALFSDKFINDWREIQRRLEELGYMSYAEVLNAKDYGVAQNRERIFIVSVMGEYNYVFPEKITLTKRLKDYLEDKVDEKYYLSDKALLGVINTNFQQTKLESRTEDKNGVIPTLCARDYKDPKLVIESILIPEATELGYAEAHDGDGVYINRPHQKRGCVQQGMIQTIKTMPNDVGVVVKDTRSLKKKLCDDLIESGVLKGGEIINHSYTNKCKNPNSRLTLEDYIETRDEIMPTLTTRCDTLGVVVKTWNEDTKAYKTREEDMPRHRIYTDDSVGFTITTNESQMPSIVKIGNYSPSGHNASSIVDKNGIAPTVMENHGTQTAIVEEQPSILQKARGNNKGGLHEISPTITSNAFQENNHLVNGLKIRKLTPRECWRLMGISDDDFDKAQASVMSNAQLYKQAGNGIVVDVFEAILSQMIERNKTC